QSSFLPAGFSLGSFAFSACARSAAIRVTPASMLLWNRCEATQVAPPTAPAIAPTKPAAPTLSWPAVLKIGGYVSGGVARGVGPVPTFPIGQPPLFPAHPTPATPVPIGHTPGISLKCRV